MSSGTPSPTTARPWRAPARLLAPARRGQSSPDAARHATPPPRGPAADDVLVREKQLQHAARFGHGVRQRALMVVVSLALTGADLAADVVAAPWELLLIFPAATALVNAAAWYAHRRGPLAAWPFWALLCFDTLVIGANVVTLGEHGYIALPFFVAVAATYGLGQPRAARVQLGLAVLVYPPARALGLWAFGGRPHAAGLIAMETACLAGLGWLTVLGPVRLTYRIRRVRRALGALERGDFTARLPTRGFDDVGFLGESFNRTAAALGRAVRAVRRSEERQRLLLEAASDTVGTLDLRGRITSINGAGVTRLGLPRHAILGAPFDAFVDAGDLADARAHFAAVCAGEVRRFELRMRDGEGRARWAAVTATPVREAADLEAPDDVGDDAPTAAGGADRAAPGAPGAPVSSVLVIVRDTEAEHAVEAALRESEAHHRLLFQASPMPMWVYDVDTLAFLAVNDAAVAQYGYSHEEFCARTLVDIRPPEDGPLVRARVRTIPDALDTSGEWRHLTKAGALLDVAVHSHPIAFAGRRARLVLAVDVTARKRLEEQLVRQAFHDPLTGLANRARFGERLRAAVAPASARRADDDTTAPAALVAVLLLDLDGFKLVNDSLGHAAGDRLLGEVADRLLNATRGCDVVARLGGDEFAVLLPHVADERDATVVAERVLRALEAPFLMDVHAVPEAYVSASIGIALASRDAADADDTDPRVATLLRDADAAMYRAKARGRNQFVVFEPAMHADAVRRLELEAELRRAVAGAELHLLYQPIVAVADGRVDGVEALVRWEHPTRGLVSPAEFIPLAEETGLIVPLGRWVLREACRQAAEWGAAWVAAGAAPSIAVNVSGRQLQHPAFVHDVAAALADAGLAPDRLVLELTESTLIQQPEIALERFTTLKALGVRLAIDDFGTGYSALSYLQRFPIDVLKVDKSFVDRVAQGGPHAALAAAVIALGQALSLRTVAEGVESSDQRAALQALGCDYAQGFLFSRPAPAAAVTALLKRPTPADPGAAAA